MGREQEPSHRSPNIIGSRRPGDQHRSASLDLQFQRTPRALSSSQAAIRHVHARLATAYHRGRLFLSYCILHITSQRPMCRINWDSLRALRLATSLLVTCAFPSGITECIASRYPILMLDVMYFFRLRCPAWARLVRSVGSWEPLLYDAMYIVTIA